MGFFFRDRHTIPRNAAFRLTEEGRAKLQAFQGDTESKVLNCLEVHGSSNLDEISRTTGISRGRLEHIMPRLVRNGRVQYVNSGGGDDLL